MPGANVKYNLPSSFPGVPLPGWEVEAGLQVHCCHPLVGKPSHSFSGFQFPESLQGHGKIIETLGYLTSSTISCLCFRACSPFHVPARSQEERAVWTRRKEAHSEANFSFLFHSDSSFGPRAQHQLTAVPTLISNLHRKSDKLLIRQ